jgi:hypothetical protein
LGQRLGPRLGPGLGQRASRTEEPSYLHYAFCKKQMAK